MDIEFLLPDEQHHLWNKILKLENSVHYSYLNFLCSLLLKKNPEYLPARCLARAVAIKIHTHQSHSLFSKIYCEILYLVSWCMNLLHNVQITNFQNFQLSLLEKILSKNPFHIRSNMLQYRIARKWKPHLIGWARLTQETIFKGHPTHQKQIFFFASFCMEKNSNGMCYYPEKAAELFQHLIALDPSNQKAVEGRREALAILSVGALHKTKK